MSIRLAPGETLLLAGEDSQEDAERDLHQRDDRAKRSTYELLCIGLIYLGIELLFSIEIALTIPIMLESHVSEQVYSWVYFLSPLLGFVFQPMLGGMSDRCNSRFGRRKPFILALAFASYIGITFILNGRMLGEWAGDSSLKPVMGIALTVIGVTILDFSADSCDSPLRAYLLDTCNYQDQHLALNLHAFVGGIGGALGYILSAMNWKKSIFSFLGSEYQILWTIVTFVFFICLTVTLKHAKEERLMNILKRRSLHNDLSDGQITSIEPSAGGEKHPLESLWLIASFFNMPKELNRLFICETVGWLAFYSTTLFFTDFVAHTIYNGDPGASPDSIQYYLYEHGTKMGSWCLLIYSISSAVSAIVIENFLIEKYSTKALFSFNFIFYFVCCVAIFYTRNIYAIFPFCSAFGIMLTCLTTLPYNILSEFHQDSMYVFNTSSGNRRGMGVDCSLLCSCHFLSQVIVSTFMSYLTFHMGNSVILLVGAFFALVGFVFVQFFVIFPKKKKGTTF